MPAVTAGCAAWVDGTAGCWGGDTEADKAIDGDALTTAAESALARSARPVAAGLAAIAGETFAVGAESVLATLPSMGTGGGDGSLQPDCVPGIGSPEATLNDRGGRAQSDDCGSAGAPCSGPAQTNPGQGCDGAPGPGDGQSWATAVAAVPSAKPMAKAQRAWCDS